MPEGTSRRRQIGGLLPRSVIFTRWMSRCAVVLAGLLPALPWSAGTVPRSGSSGLVVAVLDSGLPADQPILRTKPGRLIGDKAVLHPAAKIMIDQHDEGVPLASVGKHDRQ